MTISWRCGTCLCFFRQHNYYFHCVCVYKRGTTLFKKLLHTVNEPIVSSSAKDTFDLPSLSWGFISRHQLYAPVHMHHSSKASALSLLVQKATRIFLRVKNFDTQVSNFFSVCVTRAGGSHYTNATPLSSKRSATMGSNKPLYCPTWHIFAFIKWPITLHYTTISLAVESTAHTLMGIIIYRCTLTDGTLLSEFSWEGFRFLFHKM